MPSLPHILLLTLGVLSCTALSSYIVARCDRRPGVAAIFSFQAGFFLLLTARCLSLAAVAVEQRAFYAAWELGGGVLAAFGGALFTVLLALANREGWLAAGFAVLALISLAAELIVPGVSLRRAFPSAPALLYLCVAAYLFLHRRRLFPELTRNVLDASVFDARDAVVVFDTQGAPVEAGTTGLEGILSFAGLVSLEDFLGRIDRARVAGGFFSAHEVRSLDPGGLTREISLSGRDGTRQYLVFANPVRAEGHSRIGSVFGFYDISEQKELEAELVARAAQLTDANARLAGSAAIARLLEAEHARRRAAEEIHRTLGGRIEELIAAIGEGSSVENLIARCREAMADIRSTVAALSAGSGAREGRT